ATPVAIPPATGAFQEIFPEATLWNLLDDRLLSDATEQGGVTEALAERMARLIRHAEAEGADGILLTCSMYGPVAEKLAAETSIPLYAPDASAFQAALEGSYQRILILASAKGPLDDAVERFNQAAAQAGRGLEVAGLVAEGAAAAATAGNQEQLVHALHSACTQHSSGYDAVLLAQYSLSPVADALSELIGKPVLAGPKLAAATLRSQLLPIAAPASTTIEPKASA
ncbi:aspartate/glutamate racemase family protein, partial [Escherichia coli]|uniref:aspartate/glutamate racemase family protein n=1 Tax=Escherichia coli TaxID=562 RepID=UPI0032E483DF